MGSSFQLVLHSVASQAQFLLLAEGKGGFQADREAMLALNRGYFLACSTHLNDMVLVEGATVTDPGTKNLYLTSELKVELTRASFRYGSWCIG